MFFHHAYPIVVVVFQNRYHNNFSEPRNLTSQAIGLYLVQATSFKIAVNIVHSTFPALTIMQFLLCQVILLHGGATSGLLVRVMKILLMKTAHVFFL